MSRTRKHKPKSELVSAAGSVFEILKAISDQVRSLGGSDEDLRRVSSDDGLALRIASVVIGHGFYGTKVDYSLTPAEMLEAAAVTPNSYEKFDHLVGANGEPHVKASLVEMPYYSTSQEALDDLALRGLRPATWHEMMAFRAQHPEALAGEWILVAFGTTRNSYREYGDRDRYFVSVIFWNNVSGSHDIDDDWHYAHQRVYALAVKE